MHFKHPIAQMESAKGVFATYYWLVCCASSTKEELLEYARDDSILM
jgi:hypothetical protein